MKIPIFNPSYELELIGRKKITQAFNNTLNSGYYINSNNVRIFEEAISNFLDIKYAIGVASGTVALEIILRTLPIPKDWPVHINSNTFFAVAESILNTGYRPKLVEIEPKSWQMKSIDFGKVGIVSHLYGNPCDAINSNFQFLIEDLSQSFGATINGQHLGNDGCMAALSLYPTKTLSAIGDAGVILTNNEDYYLKAKALINHGQTSHQTHSYCGTTARMDEVQAAILNLKLKHINFFISERKALTQIYRKLLADLPLRLPFISEKFDSVTNLMVIQTKYRDDLKAFLTSKGISTGIHYPTPIHLTPAFSEENWANVSLPLTESLSQEILSLPLWVGMTERNVNYVCNNIKSFLNTKDKL